MELTNTADALYQGWDAEAMREAGDVASYVQVPSSPGFTAINQRPVQAILPPQSLAIPQTQQNQAKACTTGKSNRNRDPILEYHFGLGDSEEPMHLLKYAPTTDGQPAPQLPVRKRRAQHHYEKSTTRKRTSTDCKEAPKQRHVSEILRVTKNLGQSSIHKLDGSTEEPPTHAFMTSPGLSISATKQQHTSRQENFIHNIGVESSSALGMEISDAIAAFSDDEDFGQLYFDFEPDTHAADDSTKACYASEPHQDVDLHIDEADFDEDLMDDDLLDIAMDTVDDSSSFRLQSSSPTKTQATDKSTLYTSPSGASAHTPIIIDEEVDSSGRKPKKFVSPVTLTTRLMAATGGEAHKPIVRPAFPAAVRDRSPIIGMSSNTMLRTCFRVGEAINQSCQAVKTGHSILIELYARVLSCERDDSQQRFTFCDLFHAKPPYIQGVYAAAIWKSVQLFEYDCARLRQQGKICRCIGTMKRNGKDWMMTILNIWEATWDDVQWVEGIVNS